MFFILRTTFLLPTDYTVLFIIAVLSCQIRRKKSVSHYLCLCWLFCDLFILFLSLILFGLISEIIQSCGPEAW